jgi:hypothetical protein
MGRRVRNIQCESIQEFISGYTEMPPAAERRYQLERAAQLGELDEEFNPPQQDTDTMTDDAEIPETEGAVDETQQQPAQPGSRFGTPPATVSKLAVTPQAARKATVNDLTLALDDLLDTAGTSIAIIRTPVATIKMPARMVSINEFSVGFFVPIESSAEFQVGASFDLEINEKKMPVLYAGGVFQLARSRYQILSFMINKEVPDEQ